MYSSFNTIYDVSCHFWHPPYIITSYLFYNSMIKSNVRNTVQKDLPHIGHININPQYLKGKDCSNLPTHREPRPFGPTNNTANKPCYYSRSKKKTTPLIPTRKMSKLSVVFRQVAFVYVLSVVQPSIFCVGV